MKAFLLIATFISIFCLTIRADDQAELSLEDATKLAKQRIKQDKLPEDHLVIRLIDFVEDRPKFYVVYFDPQIPDTSSDKNDVFVGYHIGMDGTIRRSTITVERRQVKAPFDSEVSLSPIKSSASAFFNQPFKLEISTSKPTFDTTH